MATVLIVDDAPDIRFLMSRVLFQAGYTVQEAGSGPEALGRLVGPEPPNLMILDLQMPDMDGWETLTRLRSDPSLAVLPVIVCSVKTSPADALRAWELGSDGYVTKPFSIADLVAEVRAVESRSDLERTELRLQRVATAYQGDPPLS